MMTIDRIAELFPYLDDMTPEQIEERIKQIRAERRIYRKSPAKARKSAVNALDKINAATKGLSQEEIDDLIKRLEDGS